MLDLVQVQSFVAVIETGSFRHAARRLSRAQPTISQHVRKLEEELGVALVRRSHARCLPTAKGETFLPHARRLLRAAEEARSALDRSRFVVGAASNIGIYLLPPLVRAFRDRFGVNPPLELAIASNPVVARRLREGEVDVAVLEWWGGPAGFDVQVWRSEPMVVIVPPDHPWVGHPAVTVEDLCEVAMIGGEPGTGTGRLLREALGADAAQLTVVSELGSTEAVKHAVAAGLGVSLVLAGAVIEEVAAGSLCAIALEGVELRKPLFVALDESTPSSAPPAQFRDLLVAGATMVTKLTPRASEFGT